MQNTTNSSEHRVQVLDGIRGLAILLVTLYRFSKEAVHGLDLNSMLRGLIQFGSSGVELFFVLSGFLITRILIDTRHSPTYFSTFYYRRSLRIFPLYYLSLILFLWILPSALNNPSLFAEARDRSLYLWTYTTNIKMSVENAWSFGYLDHFWSLAVEEHFYLVWPIIVLCAGNRLLKITISAIVATILGRSIFCALSQNEVAPDVLTIFRCDGLLIGAAISIAWQSETLRTKLQKWAPMIGPASIIVVLTFTLLNKRFLDLPIVFLEIGWGCLLIVALTPDRFSSLRKILELPFFRSLGKYSYAMYVFQSPLIPIIALLGMSFGFAELSSTSILWRITYVVAMFALTWFLAYLSWIAIESKILRLRDRSSTQLGMTTSKS